MKKSIFNYTIEELEDIFIQNGFKKYNASQVFDWIYRKAVFDIEKMTNLSLEFKKYLSDNFSFELLKIVARNKEKSSEKFLFELNDKNTIEVVLLHHGYGKSLCVSTEIGCNMNCSFCASGRIKKIRNLEAFEMVAQLLTIQKTINARISSVVLMGIGEPFDNYDNVIKFVNLLINQKGISIAQRKVVISTCGIVPKIYEFAKFKPQVNLAISLHSSSDEVRNKLMPINKVYNIEKLFKALDYYIENTNRRVSIEYILIDGVNDSKEDALRLVKLLKNKLVYVNVIPYNETKLCGYKRSSDENIDIFLSILKKNGIDVTKRKEMGSGVNGACGQLKANNDKN